MKILLALLLSLIIMQASQNCSIKYEIMYQIAFNEHNPKRAVGYPYKISFNIKEESKLLTPHETMIERLDSRSIDCKDLETCVFITKHLLDNGATSLDLGPFQANSKYYLEDDLKIYFQLDKAYMKACKTIEDLAKTHGWSWQTIGRYHSGTPELNKAYVAKIQKRINK